MNVRVDLNYPIYDGAEIVFKAPCGAASVTGLVVYYPSITGMVSSVFSFADAHANDLKDLDELFAAGAVVKVILDTETSMAFVQNAATNGYIEGKFTDLSVATKAILYTAQTLTDDQKDQARANVGAASKSVVDTLKQAVEAIQAELDYKPIDITKFTNSAAGTYEMGRVINSLTISWELSKTPASQTLKGETLGVNVRSKTYTNVSTSQNYSLSVKDERGATDSASSSVMFYNGVYYGVMEDGATINDAAILALTKKLQGSRGITFTANAGSNKRHAYALPTRYGTPVFKDADTNLGADFYKANSQPIQFTNASGYTESYDVWLSTNKELGSLTVAVS